MSSLPPPASRVVRLAVIFEAGLALVAVAAGGVLRRPLWDQLNCHPADLTWGVAASAPMLVALALMIRYPIGPLRQLLELTRTLIVPMFRGCTLAELALVSALAGIGEELLFRGVGQQALAERLGPVAGVTIASLAFGLVHAVTTTYAVLATLVGAYLGIVCLATGNLIAPIVAHAVYDFVALWILVRQA